MKRLFYYVIFSFLLTGCAPKFMQEVIENQYLEKVPFKDPKATYIGEWTAATSGALISIKINESGNIKMCSSNPYFGSSNGILFKENDKIKMIFESGSQYELLSASKDLLICDFHGHQYKFYFGKVSDTCRDIFDKFSVR